MLSNFWLPKTKFSHNRYPNCELEGLNIKFSHQDP